MLSHIKKEEIRVHEHKSTDSMSQTDKRLCGPGLLTKKLWGYSLIRLKITALIVLL